MALRVDAGGNPAFEELFERVKEVALGAYDHQDLPFERLVAELAPDRDLFRDPIVQVMFALQNAPSADWELSGVEVERFDRARQLSKFDLSLFLTESSDGSLSGRLVFASELFDRATIERFAGHFTTLLEAAVTDPACPIGDLPMLTEGEREQILGEFSVGPAAEFGEVTVQGLVQEQVGRSPEATAVVCGETALSYRELNSRANQFAHYLMGRGVGRGSLVAVCVDRSADLVMALLGILKAGAAYVPLDPDYPAQRLQVMLEDTQAPVIVTQEQFGDRLPATTAVPVFLDRDWPAIAEEVDTDPEPRSGPDRGRLHDLHFRLDRHSQRRHGLPPSHHQLSSLGNYEAFPVGGSRARPCCRQFAFDLPGAVGLSSVAARCNRSWCSSADAGGIDAVSGRIRSRSFVQHVEAHPFPPQNDCRGGSRKSGRQEGSTRAVLSSVVNRSSSRARR